MLSPKMFLLIPHVGWPEMLLILGVVLVIFGPQKLPEIAEAMGSSIRKFRSATKEMKNDIEQPPEVRRPADED